MDTVPLHRVEAGLYATHDGRYGIARIDGVGLIDVGAYIDASTDTVWVITDGHPKTGEELPGEYPTKRAAVAALARLLAHPNE